MSGEVLIERVRGACDEAARLVNDPALQAELQAVRERVDGPLRVAIAGRIKAGKSTLLNALVGERLAATDAGECTRIVTWYREGIGYRAIAEMSDGAVRELEFQRPEGGALCLMLDGVRADDVDRLVVDWPSSALRRATLIDTPGLASLDDSTSARTRAFLAMESENGSEADAVIYLMRHLHRRDADFLDAFKDRSLANVSPVNAVAVLSRADEIGAGRVDAMTSADRIAQRYEGDERIGALCIGVIPVAGLVAETGYTLQEQEFAHLKTVAQLPDDQLDLLLLSTERFSGSALSALPVDVRHRLLVRLGMFGVRYSVDAIREGRVKTATDLANALIEVSGLGELRRVIDGHFLPRATTLKGRSALSSLRRLARLISSKDPAASQQIEATVEAIEASAHEFAELRLAHLVLSGAVTFSDEEVDEARRMTAGGDARTRLGLDSGAAATDVQAAALAGVERWRTRGASPMATPTLRDAAEVMARSYEGLYLESRESAPSVS